MDTMYIWRIGKRSHRAHIENSETERTFCQVENCGGKPLAGKSTELPAGRRVCANCIDLAGRDRADYREPDVRVLMGERLADTDPELLAGIIAPKPWKRGKQTNRSKGHRPKRSNVKYPRPFDDEIPW